MPARTGKAKIAGVIGCPVAHSLSPALHEYWLAKYNIDGAYVPMHVSPDNLQQALEALPKLGFRGINITLPHKEEVFQAIESLDESAKAIGAVNTIKVNNDGSLTGSNTDAYGFIENLKNQVADWSPANTKALIIGAGGAAKAAAYGLISEGCNDLIVCNRSYDKAQNLAKSLQIKSLAWEKRNQLADYDINLLVNTTQLGMKGQKALEIDLSNLPQNTIIYDIVYNPLITPLLEKAKQHNLQIVTGLGMLLYQAEPGFEEWFGIRPEVTEELHQYIAAIIE